jgi:hypothetical protein
MGSPHPVARTKGWLLRSTAAFRISALGSISLPLHAIQHSMSESDFSQAEDWRQKEQYQVERPVRMGRWLQTMPIASFVLLMVVMSAYRPLESTFFYLMGAGLAVFSMLLIPRLRGRNTSGKFLLSLLPITRWMVFAPLFVAAILFVNGATDHLPLEHHEQIVTSKSVTHARGPNYFVEFTSWRQNRSSEKVEIQPQLYDQLRVNDRIIVDVHPGALHIPWMGTIRKAN